MKFGRRIKDARYAEWADSYIDYSGLKKRIKNTVPWTDIAEADFHAALRAELEKTESFQKAKADDVTRRIAELEREVERLVRKAGTADSSDDDEAEHTRAGAGAGARTRDAERAAHLAPGHDDAGSDDDDDDGADTASIASYDAIEERFKELEEDVAVLVADVHDLALFTKLNFTGFMKIVKKHDKLTGFALKPTFSKDFLEAHPFYKMNYDPVIVKLSKLFDLVRTRGHPVEGDASAGGSQNAFVRSTTKYWVHEDNIVPLKLNIMKHLPVLVFDPSKEFSIKDSAITSIYYDNADLELYLGRLEKTEGAEAIRMRWYGDVDGKTIFVERKTHREDWTGEKSVKERFTIKEDKLNDYCAGRYTMDAEFDELVKKGKKTEKEVENMKQLANEIQYAIITRQLRPVMRSFYNRTAFQLPGNATVRISLDTELTLVREDNFDGHDRTHGNWRRVDFGIDHPFPTVAPADKELFPYGVLEVKLATKVGEEPPQWIRDLISSHLVEAVPKFSKFIHGCAALLPERVDLVPFWLPQMDQDIRKPVSARSRVLIERPRDSAAQSSASASPAPSPSPAQPPSYHEPESEGEDDEYLVAARADDEEARLRLPPGAKAEARAAREHREKLLRAYGDDKAGPSMTTADDATPDASAFQRPTAHRYKRALNVDPLTSADRFDSDVSQLDRRLRTVANGRDGDDDDDEDEHAHAHAAARPDGYIDDDDADADLVAYTSEFRAPAGKRIAVPVRIEPKVIFAAERTFLKWSHFAVLLSAVSITLTNFTRPDDAVGFVAAAMFTAVAELAIVYAGAMYVWRVRKMRRREAVRYHDKYGPTALCLALIASVAVNLALRVREL
ncbi:vacuolar transporter chaperone [Cryptotrichosporon argae]